jgi:DNA-binding transcriptional regulator YhcF (GntR family)
MEVRRRGRVRREVPETADEEQRECPPEARQERETDEPGHHGHQPGGRACIRAGRSPRDEKGRRHRSGAEDADDQAGNALPKKYGPNPRPRISSTAARGPARPACMCRSFLSCARQDAMAAKRDAGKTTADGPGGLKTIARIQRSTEVRNQLEAAIRRGDFAPGSKIPSERELVETFGVSRVSVREAIRSLEALGQVTVQHGRGVFVNDRRSGVGEPMARWLDLHRDETVELIDVRAALDATAVRCPRTRRCRSGPSPRARRSCRPPGGLSSSGRARRAS